VRHLIQCDTLGDGISAALCLETHTAGQARKNLEASVTKTRISLKGFWMSQILTLSLYLPLTSSASLPGPGNSPPWYHPVELLLVVVTSRGRQSNETGPARKKKGRVYIMVGHVKGGHRFRRLQLQRNSQTTTSKLETPANQKRFTANTDSRPHVRIFMSQ